MRLSGPEFIRRFLLHVLPKGLLRLRHYGFLGNRCRAKKLQHIRAVFGRDSEPMVSQAPDDPANALEGYPCLKCHQGMMRVLTLLPPVRWTGH